MIVRERPNAVALLFALRGSIVPEILPHIICVALFASGVTALSHSHLVEISAFSVMPVTLLGIALSILLGFRNNAAYDRWWEARKQWGQMVFEVRSLARASGSLLGEDSPVRRALLMRVLAHAHALNAQLRKEPLTETLTQWVAQETLQAARQRSNPAEAFIAQCGQLLGAEYLQGRLDSMGLKLLDERLTALSGIQAACERIAATPLPFAYTLLVHRTAYAYCYLLPSRWWAAWAGLRQYWWRLWLIPSSASTSCPSIWKRRSVVIPMICHWMPCVVFMRSPWPMPWAILHRRPCR